MWTWCNFKHACNYKHVCNYTHVCNYKHVCNHDVTFQWQLSFAQGLFFLDSSLPLQQSLRQFGVSVGARSHYLHRPHHKSHHICLFLRMPYMCIYIFYELRLAGHGPSWFSFCSCWSWFPQQGCCCWSWFPGHCCCSCCWRSCFTG